MVFKIKTSKKQHYFYGFSSEYTVASCQLCHRKQETGKRKEDFSLHKSYVCDIMRKIKAQESARAEVHI